MKIIAIKDSKSGGYTAYHADFPSIIIQVESMDVIKEDIINIFNDIVMSSEIIEEKI